MEARYPPQFGPYIHSVNVAVPPIKTRPVAAAKYFNIQFRDVRRQGCVRHGLVLLNYFLLRLTYAGKRFRIGGLRRQDKVHRASLNIWGLSAGTPFVCQVTFSVSFQYLFVFFLLHRGVFRRVFCSHQILKAEAAFYSLLFLLFCGD